MSRPSATDPSPPTAAGLSSPGFDAYARDYDSALNQGLQYTGETREYFAAGRARWLASRLPSSPPVRACLDFGCGTGAGSTPLLDAFPGASCLGFDPSPESIGVAAASVSRPGSQVRFTSSEDAIPSSAFDLAFTNGVFHHIPPALRLDAARLVWRSLKPGGWFAFWENNRWNPVVHLLMSRVPFDHDAQMLFPHQARSLLHAAGFEIRLTDYLFIFPGSLGFLRPLEPRLCRLPLGGQYLVLARKPSPPQSPQAS